MVVIANTILNAGALGANIFNSGGTITSVGYNLSSDDGGGYLTGPGDQINTDPLLASFTEQRWTNLYARAVAWQPSD